MSRILGRTRSEVPELEPYFQAFEERMGFLPNSMLAMAHKPALVRALTELAQVVYDPACKTSRQLRNMVGYMASRAAGCMYCSAHAAGNSGRSKIEDEKIAAIWDFEQSPLFTDAERAALRFAYHAAVVPNAVTDEDVAQLARLYGTEEMVEIMTVVAWFGFLNRWNDSLATRLEEPPRSFAERTVGGSGWVAGKHAAEGS
ncbi:MAG: carboxymuconolactone decarboxylase family protein [Acidimicrobiia bacterium]